MTNNTERQHHSDKQIAVDNQKPAQAFLSEGKEKRAQGQGELIPVTGEREGFHKTQTADCPGLLLCQSKTQGAAPVVEHQGDVGEPQGSNEIFQIAVMGQEAVIDVGLVAVAKTDQVQSDTTIVATKRLDHVAPQVTGGGIAMDEQQYRSFTFINIVQAVAIQRDVT